MSKIKKKLDVYKKVISDYEIKVSAFEEDLPALKEKISKPNKRNEIGKQEKCIKYIAQVENFVIPKVHKEAVSLHPNKTKDSLLCPVKSSSHRDRKIYF